MAMLRSALSMSGAEPTPKNAGVPIECSIASTAGRPSRLASDAIRSNSDCSGLTPFASMPGSSMQLA
jgi:hypothetical protein